MLFFSNYSDYQKAIGTLMAKGSGAWCSFLIYLVGNPFSTTASIDYAVSFFF